VTRLRAAGLTTHGVRSTHSRVVELGRQGPALALPLLLGCAIAGTVLAVGGTAISVSASSRRRSFELAALRAIGISRSALLRAGVWEQLLLLGTAVVLGVPGGFIAARLAIPAIPEFSDSTPVQLQYGPPALPVLLFTGAYVVLLAPRP
jgi:putative ABC transport system permease protein